MIAIQPTEVDQTMITQDYISKENKGVRVNDTRCYRPETTLLDPSMDASTTTVFRRHVPP